MSFQVLTGLTVCHRHPTIEAAIHIGNQGMGGRIQEQELIL